MPDPVAALQNRAQKFLNFVVDHSNSRTTEWGDYRHFDVHGLAHMALGRDLQRGFELLNGSLDMIEQNFRTERENPHEKWHLADFAMHPLLRAHFLFSAHRQQEHPVWTRIEAVACGFLLHFGDLTENHNLLHLAIRYLVSVRWPDARLSDGRRADEHREEAQTGIEEWILNWTTKGSAEWGSDIYYNVNFLALLNLHDFAADERMRQLARGILDLFALDEALDSFAGGMVGAARRAYAVYRLDVGESPSRPLHYVWFDAPGSGTGFNLNFIGGVLQAATSRYSPSAAICYIANDGAPSENRTTHTTGVWWPNPANLDHLSKYTTKLRSGVLGVLNSSAGGGRFTEQSWQVTLGEKALVFGNEPSVLTAHSKMIGRDKPVEEVLALYATAVPGTLPEYRALPSDPWYFVYANMPPGHPGDVRPGFWQGNSEGPLSFGTDRLAFIVHHFREENPLPYAHLYLPRAEFDEIIESGPWIFLRKGSGFAALWIPEGYEAVTTGYWAGVETRLHGNPSAVLATIGDTDANGAFAAFQSQALTLAPEWDPACRRISANSPLTGERLSVAPDTGPLRNGAPISTKGCRFETPWGSMPLGAARINIQTPAGTHDIDLERLSLAR